MGESEIIASSIRHGNWTMEELKEIEDAVKEKSRQEFMTTCLKTKDMEECARLWKQKPEKAYAYGKPEKTGEELVLPQGMGEALEVGELMNTPEGLKVFPKLTGEQAERIAHELITMGTKHQKALKQYGEEED